MARPKSDDKRDSILSAAAAIFAERGLGAPTSAVSKAANVAEGTLFTYFPTKDDLLNELYRDIKRELAEVLMSGFARKKDARAKVRSVWQRYVDWGVRNPQRRNVLNQLTVSGRLSEETKASSLEPFMAIEELARQAIAEKVVRDMPLELIRAAMEASTAAAIDLAAANPAKAGKYRRLGFEILWNGIRR